MLCLLQLQLQLLHPLGLRAGICRGCSCIRLCSLQRLLQLLQLRTAAALRLLRRRQLGLQLRQLAAVLRRHLPALGQLQVQLLLQLLHVLLLPLEQRAQLRSPPRLLPQPVALVERLVQLLLPALRRPALLLHLRPQLGGVRLALRL